MSNITQFDRYNIVFFFFNKKVIPKELLTENLSWHDVQHVLKNETGQVEDTRRTGRSEKVSAEKEQNLKVKSFGWNKIQ